MPDSQSSIPLVISIAVLVVALCGYGKPFPSPRDFRIVAASLGIFGLCIAAAVTALRWHLLWYVPMSLVVAYGYALRHLLRLSRDINRLPENWNGDPEQMRKMIEQRVKQYNDQADQDDQMK